MKICPSCGSELSDDLSFCPSDGSPLLSEEEEPEVESSEPEVGDKTLVMSDEPEFGDETVAMPGNDVAGEKTVFMGGEESEEVETEIPNRDDEGVGDATFVMPEPIGEREETASSVPSEEIPATPDDTMFPSDDESSEGVESDFEEEPGEEWEEEAPSVTEGFSVPVGEAPEETGAEEEGDGSGSEGAPPDEPKKKSRIGLIIALVVLFFTLVIIVAAAAGILWYVYSRPQQTANANTNIESNANEAMPTPTEDLGSVEETPSPEETPETEVSPEESPGATPSPSKRPTPSPRTTASATPIPTPVRTPDNRPTPFRTPTPVRSTPTPVQSTPTPTIPTRISGGVVNGRAISLPRPEYPAAARAANIKGSVTVAVIISKTGRVIAARAVSGPTLLRSAAQSAARRARFRPTLVSGQPVEVEGSIVYNFQ